MDEAKCSQKVCWAIRLISHSLEVKKQRENETQQGAHKRLEVCALTTKCFYVFGVSRL